VGVDPYAFVKSVHTNVKFPLFAFVFLPVQNNFPVECKGKIFFSIVSRRITEFLLANKYVDTSLQKGGIPGFSGCVEHTSAITQMI
jgi:hypothetical protein